MKSGQKEELLLNLIFPDYFNDNSNNESEGKGEGESNDKQSAKEKEADKSTSNSAGCSYTPRLVTSTEMNPNACNWIVGGISILAVKFIKFYFCN